MMRKLTKYASIATVGSLLLFGLLVFIMEQLDNRMPVVVQPPDRTSSFVETLDLHELVASTTPVNVELKFVSQGSGGGSGQFKHDRDPSIYRGPLLVGATSRKHITFEMTCDAELRAAFLSHLRDAMQKSLNRWYSNVQVSNSALLNGSTAADGFLLEYKAEGQPGDYEGEIRVAIEGVPKDHLRPSEADKVIHSLSIASSEERWAYE